MTDRYGAPLIALIQEGQEAGQLVPGDPEPIALAYLGYLNGIGLVATVSASEDAPNWDAMSRISMRILGPTDMIVATS